MEFKDVCPVYTGGGIYIFFGYVKYMNIFVPFMADEDAVSLLDEDSYTEEVWDGEWQHKHIILDVINVTAFLSSLYDFILETKPNGGWCNYLASDIEAMKNRLKGESK